MKANRTSHSFARIEMLESRRLLSAGTISVMAPMPATPAAVHSHPTVPSVLGSYSGTYAASNGTSGGMIITISSEGKTGKVAGTLTIVGLGSLDIGGSVNVKGKFSMRGSAHHFAITISGSVSSNGNTLSGRFNTTAKHGSAHGTVTATKTVI
jgi:hypothetical protein